MNDSINLKQSKQHATDPESLAGRHALKYTDSFDAVVKLYHSANMKNEDCKFESDKSSVFANSARVLK